MSLLLSAVCAAHSDRPPEPPPRHRAKHRLGTFCGPARPPDVPAADLLPITKAPPALQASSNLAFASVSYPNLTAEVPLRVPLTGPGVQPSSPVSVSNSGFDLEVELWGFEPQTSCMPCPARSSDLVSGLADQRPSVCGGVVLSQSGGVSFGCQLASLSQWAEPSPVKVRPGHAMCAHFKGDLSAAPYQVPRSAGKSYLKSASTLAIAAITPASMPRRVTRVLVQYFCC